MIKWLDVHPGQEWCTRRRSPARRKKAYIYYDLVKSYRQGDKVRVKFIKHLGKKPVITAKLVRELVRHPEISKEDLKKLKPKM